MDVFCICLIETVCPLWPVTQQRHSDLTSFGKIISFFYCFLILKIIVLSSTDICLLREQSLSIKTANLSFCFFYKHRVMCAGIVFSFRLPTAPAAFANIIWQPLCGLRGRTHKKSLQIAHCCSLRSLLIIITEGD